MRGGNSGSDGSIPIFCNTRKWELTRLTPNFPSPDAKEIVRNKVNAALLAGSTLWCLSVVAAPAFRLSWVYLFFSMICHQDPTRSWHIFGESLPVCIRCASIYFAFTASLWLGIRTNIRWLRMSLFLMLCEFIVARVLIDAASLRSLSGILVGLSAAPFVKQGVEEIRDLL
jgi:uncharacterized membrane protein